MLLDLAMTYLIFHQRQGYCYVHDETSLHLVHSVKFPDHLVLVNSFDVL